LSAGTLLPVALAAADLAARQGHSTAVFSMPTIKPLDQSLLAEVFGRFKLVATLEEHSVLGGLGGSIAEWLADHPAAKARLLRFGTADVFLHETCEQEEAREHFGLTSHAVAERIGKALA
jgi:transketolase